MSDAKALSISRIHKALWVFLVLLFIEGALRKWIIPPLQLPLLFVRVPVTVYAVWLGFNNGLLRKRPLLTIVMWLGAIAFSTSLFVCRSFLTTGYGWVVDYLPVPMMYLYATVFDEHDFERLNRWLLFISLPHALLMVLQYQSGFGSWINKTPDQVGVQIAINADHIRPPGFFSQTVGAAYLYGLIFAFALAGPVRQRADLALRVAGLAGCLLAMTAGGSRTLVMIGACTIVAYLLNAAAQGPGKLFKFIIGAVLVGGLSFATIQTIPVLEDSLNTFMENRVASDPVDLGRRLAAPALEPFQVADNTGPVGHGLGVGTTIGAAASGITSYSQYGDDETDYVRAVIESGPYMGMLYDLGRTGLIVFFILQLFKRKTSPLSAALMGSTLPLLWDGNMGNMMESGFFIVSVGLAYGSLRLTRSVPTGD